MTVTSGVKGKYNVEVRWNDPDNTVSNYQITPYSSEQGGFANPQHAYTKAGKYTVEIIATDASGNYCETSSVVKVGDTDDSDDSDNDGGNDQFTATVNVPGYTVSFNPNPFFTLATEVQGQTGYISIVAYEDPYNALDSSSMQIIIDTKQVSGPGAYSIGLSLTDLGDNYSNGAATITFFTDDIKNEDDDSPVIFAATSGTITFTKFSTGIGDTIKGTFSANIMGDHVTGQDSEGDDISEELTGTVSGSFNLNLK